MAKKPDSTDATETAETPEAPAPERRDGPSMDEIRFRRLHPEAALEIVALSLALPQVHGTDVEAAARARLVDAVRYINR